jgi:hypothetical protein
VLLHRGHHGCGKKDHRARGGAGGTAATRSGMLQAGKVILPDVCGVSTRGNIAYAKVAGGAAAPATSC